VFVFHSVPIRVAEDKTDFTVNGGELAEFDNAGGRAVDREFAVRFRHAGNKIPRATAGAMPSEGRAKLRRARLRGTTINAIPSFAQGYILI
jgi:hypothetical protein